MKLIIVESPTKAKTISKLLGKGYTVKSSFGHVRDLPTSKMGIDIEHDFKPHYIIPAKAKPKVAELKEYAADAEKIILASDEDREGEAIAWHIAEILNLTDKEVSRKNSRAKQYERIAFHEITETAIKKALENPRKIDFHLVDAQQARRVLDRLVGYELSPFLWKKIKKGLSAGRVQSVAVRFIVEREREIEKFTNQEYWTIDATVGPKKDEKTFESVLTEINQEKVEQIEKLELFAGTYTSKKTTILSKSEASKITENLKTSDLKIRDIVQKEIKRNPPAPFTTSTLQQAAINALGYSSEQTMRIAQKLYEEGFITYMRTDSVNLSLESMLAAQKTIKKMFGQEYAMLSPRFFTTKSKGAQEAHEAIRPTYPDRAPETLRGNLDPGQHRLYQLIWRRMIASQMESAVMNSQRIEIEAFSQINKNNYLLQANGLKVKFDGYLKVYEGKAPEKETILPPMKIGDKLTISSVRFNQKSTTPPPRYTEAGLVKALEEFGVGRPSTYAPTISTIMKRKYIEKNEDKRLYPLEIGMMVNDLLVEHFAKIVDPKFTAEMEKDLDLVADGDKEWVPLIKEFYFPFHENLIKKTGEVKKEDVLEKLDRQCPKCGGDLIVKFGRFGKFIACGNYPTCDYTEKTEEDKEMDKLAEGISCDKCGAPMIVKRGRFGAFLGCSNYPNCKNIQRIENKTGIKCPTCKQGDIVERRSKKGKNFFGCNRYPDCKFAVWSKPTGENCPQCGSLLLFAAKGKIKCSNKECKYEISNSQ